MSEQEHERDPLEVVEEIREVAYQRGFREGFMEGRNRGFGDGITKGLEEKEKIDSLEM